MPKKTKDDAVEAMDAVFDAICKMNRTLELCGAYGANVADIKRFGKMLSDKVAFVGDDILTKENE